MTPNPQTRWRRKFAVGVATEEPTGPWRNRRRRLRADTRGFTLMEVVVVLIVMGIITAFAVSRGSSEGVELKVRSEVVKTHLRHAQLRAMNAGSYWGIATNSTGSAYWLFRHDGTTTQVILPGEEAITVDLAQEEASISPGIYSFDERGIPYFTEYSNTPPGAALAANLDVTIAKASDSVTFSISQHTGFIE